MPLAFADQDVDGMTMAPAASVDNRGISLPYLPETGEMTEDGMPIGNDVTSDVAVRRAINVAIDREALVAGILNGCGTPAFTAADGQPWPGHRRRTAVGGDRHRRDPGWPRGQRVVHVRAAPAGPVRFRPSRRQRDLPPLLRFGRHPHPQHFSDPCVDTQLDLAMSVTDSDEANALFRAAAVEAVAILDSEIALFGRAEGVPDND